MTDHGKDHDNDQVTKPKHVAPIHHLPNQPDTNDWRVLLPSLARIQDRQQIDSGLLVAAARAYHQHQETLARFEEHQLIIQASHIRLQDATLDAQLTFHQLAVETDQALQIDSRFGFSLLSTRTSTRSISPKMAEEVDFNVADAANASAILHTQKQTTKKKRDKPKATAPLTDTTALRHVSNLIDEVIGDPLPSIVKRQPISDKQAHSKTPQPTSMCYDVGNRVIISCRYDFDLGKYESDVGRYEFDVCEHLFDVGHTKIDVGLYEFDVGDEDAYYCNN